MGNSLGEQSVFEKAKEENKMQFNLHLVDRALKRLNIYETFVCDLRK